MNKVNFAITITTTGFVVFAIICAADYFIPMGSLLLFLLLLNIGLVWMVITILKEGESSHHTFDERFYEDADKGPGPSGRRSI